MRRKLWNRCKNKKGSALIAVLIVFVVFVVLGAAVISLSLASGSQTQAQIYQQQAYFAAKSAVSATMKYISDPNTTNLRDNVNALTTGNTLIATPTFNLPAATPATALKNVQSCPITITKISATSLQVKATATVHSITATAIAYMKNTGSTGTIVNPFNNIFYSTNSSSTLDFSSAKDIYGNIYVGGTFNFNNSGNIHGNIYAQKFIGNNNGAIYGNVYTSSDVTFPSSTKIAVDPADLNSGNLFCGGNVTYGNWSASVAGNVNITYSHTVTPYRTTDTAQIKNIVQTSTVPSIASPVDFSNVINDINSYFSNCQSAMDSNSFNLTTPDNTPNKHPPISIGTNGILAGHLSNGNVSSAGYTVNVNTGSGDVVMNIDSKYFGDNPVNLASYKIQVTGTHNFYVYLTGNTTLQLSGGDPIITMQNYNSTNMQNPASLDPPHIFVIGTGSQTVYLANDSEIDGYVFLPNGTFKSDGDKGHNGYCVFGGVIADSIPSATGSSGTWQHVSPNLSGTPLEHMGTYVLPGSGGGSGSSSWTLDGWADK